MTICWSDPNTILDFEEWIVNKILHLGLMSPFALFFFQIGITLNL
jgi:hypothetical protein